MRPSAVPADVTQTCGYFFDFEIYASLLFSISYHFSVESPDATFSLGSKKIPRVIALRTRGSLLQKIKIPSVTNTYDTRLISVQAGQMPQAAYLDPSKGLSSVLSETETIAFSRQEVTQSLPRLLPAGYLGLNTRH